MILANKFYVQIPLILNKNIFGNKVVVTAWCLLKLQANHKRNTHRNCMSTFEVMLKFTNIHRQFIESAKDTKH